MLILITPFHKAWFRNLWISLCLHSDGSSSKRLNFHHHHDSSHNIYNDIPYHHRQTYWCFLWRIWHSEQIPWSYMNGDDQQHSVNRTLLPCARFKTKISMLTKYTEQNYKRPCGTLKLLLGLGVAKDIKSYKIHFVVQPLSTTIDQHYSTNYNLP